MGLRTLRGRLHSIALERCEIAARLSANNPDAKLLLTGGYGQHFNTTSRPHAAYLRQRLVSLGVAESRFLPDALSRNTLEDAGLSKPIVLEHAGRYLVVVTSDYHVPRARFLFEREFADTEVALFFVPSVTDEADCDLELSPLKVHEKRALARLLGEVDGA